MFFPTVGGSNEERSSESRRALRITSGIPPELSNLINQVLATERIGPLRRGGFVLCTTNLRSWIAADAKHLHHTIFINTANSVCRGAGDSHLPQPSCSFPIGGSTANGRGTKFREPTGHDITPGKNTNEKDTGKYKISIHCGILQFST